MNRCKVICHMMTSIDGKIDGKFMEEKGCSVSGDYYDKQIWKLGNANGNGRTTAQMYFANKDIDYGKYKNTNIDYSDFIVKSDYYWVVFDRTGKCNWNTNIVNYGEKDANVVMVLTKSVSKEYLAHLQSLNVSYIITGDNEIDLDIALTKLKKLYGIDNLVLCGGAIINGVFHNNDKLDEISLVVAPYIEGNNSYKGIAETNLFTNQCYKFVESKSLEDGAVHLRFKKTIDR